MVHNEHKFAKMNDSQPKAMMKATGDNILPKHLVLMYPRREKLGTGKMNDCPLDYTLMTTGAHCLGTTHSIPSEGHMESAGSAARLLRGGGWSSVLALPAV